jgi:hypothetical protein
MTLRRQLNSNAVITKSATKGLLRDGGLVAMAIVANDDRAGRKLQDYEPIANCVRIFNSPWSPGQTLAISQ